MSSTVVCIAEPVNNKVLPSDKTGLPWELWQMILSWLSVMDLCHVARVCRTWNELVNSIDTLRWKELYLSCNEWRHPFWPLNTNVEPPSWRQAYRDQYIATRFWKWRHKHEANHTSCTIFFKRTSLHKTIHVGAGLEHENLKSALAVANAYDRIVVHPGIYDEQVEITARIPFELIGDGELGSIILVMGIQQVALTARLSNLVLRAPWFTSFIVMINSGYLQIDKCILEEGMICAQSPSTVHIKFCTFRHATVILQHMNTSIIENCEFSQSYSANIIIEGQPKSEKNWTHTYLREQTNAIFYQKRSMHRKKHGLKNTTSMTSTLHSSFTSKSLTTGYSSNLYDTISHDPSCNLDDPGATFIHPSILSGRYPATDKDGMVGCGDLQSMYQEPEDQMCPPAMTKSSLSLPLSRSNHSKTIHGSSVTSDRISLVTQGLKSANTPVASSTHTAITTKVKDKDQTSSASVIAATKPMVYLSQEKDTNTDSLKSPSEVSCGVVNTDNFTVVSGDAVEKQDRIQTCTHSSLYNCENRDCVDCKHLPRNVNDSDKNVKHTEHSGIPPLPRSHSLDEQYQNSRGRKKSDSKKSSKASGGVNLEQKDQILSMSHLDFSETKQNNNTSLSMSQNIDEFTSTSSESAKNDSLRNFDEKGKENESPTKRKERSSYVSQSSAADDGSQKAAKSMKSHSSVDTDNMNNCNISMFPYDHHINVVTTEKDEVVGSTFQDQPSVSKPDESVAGIFQDQPSTTTRTDGCVSSACQNQPSTSVCDSSGNEIDKCLEQQEVGGFYGRSTEYHLRSMPRPELPPSLSDCSVVSSSDHAPTRPSVHQYALRHLHSDEDTLEESDDDISILDELDESDDDISILDELDESDEEEAPPNRYSSSSSTDSSDVHSVDYTGSGDEFSSSEESVIMLPHLREFDQEPLNHSTSPRGVEAEIRSINSNCTRPVPVNVSEDKMMSSFADQIQGVLVHQCRMNHSKGGLMVTLQAHAIISECEINNVGYGIRCIHNSRVVILKNKIHHCRTSGIFMRLSASGLIAGNDIHSNNEAGIDIRKNADPLVQFNQIHHGKRSGVVVLGSGRGQIKKNDIFCNTEAGVYILYGGSPTISENYIYEGRAAGVAVNAKGKGYIIDNVIRGNRWGGIDIRNSSCPVVSGNSIINGLSDGIVIGVGGKGHIENNNITGNSGSGIWMMSAKHLNIHGNQICCNGHCGVLMLDKSTTPLDVHLNQLLPGGITHHSFSQYEDNFAHPEPKAAWAVLQYNNISHNKSQGIVIEIQEEVHVSHNAVHGNLKDGIVMLQDALAIVEGNSITHNTGHGLVTSMKNKVKVTGNGIYDNTQHGVLCQNECMLEENDVVGQAGCAVMADGTSCVEMVHNRLSSSAEPAVKGGKQSKVVARKNKIYDKGSGDFLCEGELISSHNTISRPTLVVMEYAKKSSEKDFGRTDFLNDPPPRPHTVPPPPATTIPTHRVTVVTKVMMPSTDGCDQGSKLCTIL